MFADVLTSDQWQLLNSPISSTMDALLEHFTLYKHDVLESIDRAGNVIYRLSEKGKEYVIERRSTHSWEDTEKFMDRYKAIMWFVALSYCSDRDVVALDWNTKKYLLYRNRTSGVYHVGRECANKCVHHNKRCTNVDRVCTDNNYICTGEPLEIALHIIMYMMDKGHVCNSCHEYDDYKLKYCHGLWSRSKKLFMVSRLKRSVDPLGSVVKEHLREHMVLNSINKDGTLICKIDRTPEIVKKITKVYNSRLNTHQYLDLDDITNSEHEFVEHSEYIVTPHSIFTPHSLAFGADNVSDAINGFIDISRERAIDKVYLRGEIDEYRFRLVKKKYHCREECDTLDKDHKCDDRKCCDHEWVSVNALRALGHIHTGSTCSVCMDKELRDIYYLSTIWRGQ